MKLLDGMTLVMFTLKLLGVFNYGWLVVFAPQLMGAAIVIAYTAGQVLHSYLRSR